MDASLLRHRNSVEWLVFLDPDEVHTARVPTAKGAHSQGCRVRVQSREVLSRKSQ